MAILQRPAAKSSWLRMVMEPTSYEKLLTLAAPRMQIPPITAPAPPILPLQLPLWLPQAPPPYSAATSHPTAQDSFPPLNWKSVSVGVALQTTPPPTSLMPHERWFYIPFHPPHLAPQYSCPVADEVNLGREEGRVLLCIDGQGRGESYYV
jgi:hypothetical protein